MKILILIAAILIIACSTPPTSKDYMGTCKSVCRGDVQHYQDDTIKCLCKDVVKK